ncbi:MAG: glycosyltransferase [Chthoniobacter sp.]
MPCATFRAFPAGSHHPRFAASRLIDRTNVAALIPCYFEAKRIRDVAARVKEQLDVVLVVDDGSTDETEREARAAGVEVIRHTVNQGKGAAIKTGLRALAERGRVGIRADPRR